MGKGCVHAETAGQGCLVGFNGGCAVLFGLDGQVLGRGKDTLAGNGDTCVFLGIQSGHRHVGAADPGHSCSSSGKRGIGLPVCADGESVTGGDGTVIDECLRACSRRCHAGFGADAGVIADSDSRIAADEVRAAREIIILGTDGVIGVCEDALGIHFAALISIAAVGIGYLGANGGDHDIGIETEAA